jgi:hypothetical protein
VKQEVAGAAVGFTWQSALPEMPIRKRSTGSGLQILLECGRSLIVFEANRRHDTPRRVLWCVWGAALIVSCYSLREVIRQSNAALFGVRDAPEEVDVLHNLGKQLSKMEI